VLTHTKPGPPPGACGFVAFSVAGPAGLAAGRGFPSAFAFLGVGLALGEAVGDSAREGDAAFSAWGEADAPFSAGAGDSGGDSPGAGD
jgi:hypothetical protein